MTPLTLTLALLLSAAPAQTPTSSAPPETFRVSPVSPTPVRATVTTLHTCNNPPLPGTRRDTRSPFALRWSTPAPITVGAFNMRDNTCVSKPYDLFVANNQPITLTLDHDGPSVCSAAITYADNAPRDFGSVIQAVLTPNIGQIQPPFAGNAPLRITLPGTGIRDTAATVTLSCQVPAADTSTSVGVQRKLVLHYGGVDLVTGSAGASLSTLGKRVFGVTTTDTGAKNPDGTPVTLSAVGITSSSRVQFVPMGFVNVNFAGNRTVNWNLQAGLGINPNGSSAEVEYFLSPIALGLRGLFLSPGLQVARSERLTGGFHLGEPVAAGFTVPTTSSATYKFGFTISYKPYK